MIKQPNNIKNGFDSNNPSTMTNPINASNSSFSSLEVSSSSGGKIDKSQNFIEESGNKWNGKNPNIHQSQMESSRNFNLNQHSINQSQILS